jgi:hypothetical protein
MPRRSAGDNSRSRKYDWRVPDAHYDTLIDLDTSESVILYGPGSGKPMSHKHSATPWPAAAVTSDSRKLNRL